jgi:hypothetical protein
MVCYFADLCKNYAFKASSVMAPISSLSFHPSGVLATGGMDGVYAFWDIDTRAQLKKSVLGDGSVTASALNPKGDVFAYATHRRPNPFLLLLLEEKGEESDSSVYLHTVQEDEICLKQSSVASPFFPSVAASSNNNIFSIPQPISSSSGAARFGSSFVSFADISTILKPPFVTVQLPLDTRTHQVEVRSDHSNHKEWKIVWNASENNVAESSSSSSV